MITLNGTQQFTHPTPLRPPLGTIPIVAQFDLCFVDAVEGTCGQEGASWPDGIEDGQKRVGGIEVSVSRTLRLKAQALVREASWVSVD